MFQLDNPVLLAVAVTLGLASGVLSGVHVAQTMRAHPSSVEPNKESAGRPGCGCRSGEHTGHGWNIETCEPCSCASCERLAQWVRDRGSSIDPAWHGSRGSECHRSPAAEEHFRISARSTSGGNCRGALPDRAGIAATAVRCLGAIDPAEFPESPALCRGARAVAWILALAAVSVVLQWAGRDTIVQVLYFVVLIADAAFCYGLFVAKSPGNSNSLVFPLDIGVLSVLGSRTNILASILDAAERQLGIDLRSTWALTVVRRSLEPLVIGSVSARLALDVADGGRH